MKKYLKISKHRSHLNNLKVQLKRLSANFTTIEAMPIRLRRVETVIKSILEVAHRTRINFIRGVTSNDKEGRIQVETSSALRAVIGYLNTKDENDFLFSGKASKVLPIDQAHIEKWRPLATDGVYTHYYKGSLAQPHCLSYEDIEIQDEVRANEPGFEKLIRGLRLASIINHSIGQGDHEDKARLIASLILINESVTDLIGLLKRVDSISCTLHNIKEQLKEQENFAQAELAQMNRINNFEALTHYSILDMTVRSSLKIMGSYLQPLTDAIEILGNEA